MEALAGLRPGLLPDLEEELILKNCRAARSRRTVHTGTEGHRHVSKNTAGAAFQRDSAEDAKKSGLFPGGSS
jgi:hypothetical protein